MKRSIASILSFVLFLSLVPSASATKNFFSKIQEYNAGRFSDVAESDWYASSVKTVYEYGIMQGDGNLFGAKDPLTIAETLTMAALFHSRYYTGSDSFTRSSPWYQVFVDYALDNGIIDQPYSDYSQPATRTVFVNILRNALPSEAFEKINEIDDDAIPDVPTTMPGAAAIYDFYRAGIVSGNDSKGTFLPNDNIDRASVAVIVSRMVDPSLRLSITFQVPKVTVFAKNSNKTLLIPITKLESYISQEWSTIPRDFATNDFPVESTGIYKYPSHGGSYLSYSEEYEVRKNTMVTWRYGSGTLSLLGCGEVTFGANYTYSYDLFGLPSHAWGHQNDMNTLYVGRNVSLDDHAFDNYSNLSRVELPDTLTKVSDYAFYDCPLTRIGIPDSVTLISFCAFGRPELSSNRNGGDSEWHLPNRDLVIYCVPGSAASEFATKYNIEQVAATQIFYPDGRTCMVTTAEKSTYLENGWYEQPMIGMYAEDGRTQVVAIGKVSNYESSGWYTNLEDICITIYSESGKELQILKALAAEYAKANWHDNKADAQATLYAVDGQTTTVWKNDIASYLATGWYTQPVTLLYANDGRTQIVATVDVPTYEKAGWSRNADAVYTTMYALDGRTNKVPNAKIAENQAVGWYLYPDYICAKADATVKTDGYAAAVNYVESAMKDSAKENYYSALVNKRNNLCSAWQKSIGCPIAILSSSIGHNSIGIPTVRIYYRNLTGTTLNALELKFTCIDAYNNVTTDWPTLYDGTFTGYSDTEYLAPYSIGGATWTLNSNERTTSIRNLHIIRAAFSDGTIWKK